MSVFDNMNDENQEFAVETGDQKFTVQFGTEEADMLYSEGLTVREAFEANADFLGFDIDRRLNYRDDSSNTYNGTECVEPGVTYIASIMHDEKG